MIHAKVSLTLFLTVSHCEEIFEGRQEHLPWVGNHNSWIAKLTTINLVQVEFKSIQLFLRCCKTMWYYHKQWMYPIFLGQKSFAGQILFQVMDLTFYAANLHVTIKNHSACNLTTNLLLNVLINQKKKTVQNRYLNCFRDITLEHCGLNKKE